MNDAAKAIVMANDVYYNHYYWVRFIDSPQPIYSNSLFNVHIKFS